MYRIIKSVQSSYDNPIGKQIMDEINTQLRYVYGINKYVLLMSIKDNPISKSLTLEFLYGRDLVDFRISEYEPIDIDHMISIIEPKVRNEVRNED